MTRRLSRRDRRHREGQGQDGVCAPGTFMVAWYPMLWAACMLWKDQFPRIVMRAPAPSMAKRLPLLGSVIVLPERFLTGVPWMVI